MPAPRTAIALLAATLAGCTLQSDAEYSASQSRRERDKALPAMQQVTRQTPRGTDLAGDALTVVLAGKTLVNRYERTPGGKPGPYIIRQHFAADGRFVFTDEPRVASRPGSHNDGYRWRVTGPRLCIQGPPAPTRWRCFRMARTKGGALQWFIDEPGDAFDGQLTIVTREITNGPPRP